MNTKNYSFGAKAPITNLDIVNEQMSLAHCYYNGLVRIERERRTTNDTAMKSMFPDTIILEQNYINAKKLSDDAEKNIKQQNSQARTKLPVNKDAKKNLALLTKNTALAEAKLKARKKVIYADPIFKPVLDASDLKAKNSIKANRPNPVLYLDPDRPSQRNLLDNHVQLYWGNYLNIEKSLCKIRSGAPPKTKKWRGDGTIALQIQGVPGARGMSVEQLYSRIHNNLAYIEPMPHNLWKSTDKTSVQPSSKWHLLHMRIGSDAKKQPIWTSIPFALHRQLAPNSRIKWIKVFRRVVGVSREWQVMFVLDNEEFPAKRIGQGVVAVDIGWKKTDNGLRIAKARDNDGNEQELIIPTNDILRWKKVKDLQSIREKNFNDMRDQLISWIKVNTIPDWLNPSGDTSLTKYIHLWKNEFKLHFVIWHWAGHKIQTPHRFSGDEKIVELLLAWSQQDIHLHQWKSHGEQKSQDWRDNLYRNFVAKLQERYSSALILKVNYAALQKKADIDEDETVKGAKDNQKIASPSRLVQFIKEKLPTTRLSSSGMNKCHICGAKNKHTGLITTCKCGAVWDVDTNACINMLAAPITEEQEINEEEDSVV